MKLSVIIPVYNTAPYLDKCLESVLNQNFDLEVICINNASTDNSLDILKKYNVKIINLEKALPVGAARNLGIKEAGGEYIHFLDSDDWLENGAYKKMFEALEKDSSIEVMQFGYKTVCNKTNRLNKFTHQTDAIRGKNIYTDPLLIDCTDNYCWDKIYKKSLLERNNILFCDLPCYEDNNFIDDVLINAKNIMPSNEILLNYRIKREGSLVSNYYLYNDCAVEFYKNSEEKSKVLSRELREKFLEKKYRNFFTIVYGAYMNKKISYAKLREYLKQADYSLFSQKTLKSGKFVYANEIIKGPEYIHLAKMFARKAIRNFLPFLYSPLLRMVRAKNEY